MFAASKPGQHRKSTHTVQVNRLRIYLLTLVCECAILNDCEILSFRLARCNNIKWLGFVPLIALMTFNWFDFPWRHGWLFSNSLVGNYAIDTSRINWLTTKTILFTIIIIYWTTLSKISWYVSWSRSIICRCRTANAWLIWKPPTNHDILR